MSLKFSLYFYFFFQLQVVVCIVPNTAFEYVLFFQNVWILKRCFVRVLISGLNFRSTNDLNFICGFSLWLIVLNPLDWSNDTCSRMWSSPQMQSLLSWYTLLITFRHRLRVSVSAVLFFRFNMGLGLPTRVTFFIIILWQVFVPLWSPLRASELL